MTGPSYRFGPFFADRIRYRVVRDDTVVELTPKLLDLLLHLLDHSGALLTKEQLLDALWPGANVTDNALAQAVSELRQALGDDAGTPQFIKTVARRGYRFIAPVARIEAAPAPPARTQPATASNAREQAIAVMDFANVTGESDSAWLSAGVAETVTGDLRALGRFRVVDRGRVTEAIRRTSGSFQEVSVLRQGAAVQDRQIGRGDRYPALGLHWLLGLVRLAQDDVEEALPELDRERQLAEPHRLYGREYEMNTLHSRGACLVRLGRSDEAADCFRRALALFPDHAQSNLGLSVALRAMGSHDVAEEAWRKALGILETLARTRPMEAAIVHSQVLAVEGKLNDAGAVLCKALDDAPPGFAAWTLPIEPFLLQLAGIESFRAALARLSQRAR